ncbi:MAG: LemA family protein [Mariprofundaceae bacterium]|nr:LemA family protein [Mariprofundaceae bacterium]
MEYVIGGIVLLLLYGIVIYNKFIALQARGEASWSDIDVQLRRRYNLIPNLLNAVKGYMDHEKNTLESITQARVQSKAASNVLEQGAAEATLANAIGKIMMVAEAYPDLKANQNFIDLQQQLAEIEDAIQNARRYYNAVVRDFNTLVESFPSLFIARMFKFLKRDFFEIENAEERANVKISF